MPNSWDESWKKRIFDGQVKMNEGKRAFLIHQLWSRPWYAKLKKLDIGCGPAVHANKMKEMYVDWTDDYCGIDLSEIAIDKAKSFGLNVMVGDVCSTEFDTKFDLFLLLDVLEHIEDHNKLSKKIKEIANDKFTVFGNIPLYLTQTTNGVIERPVNIFDLEKFIRECNLNKFWHEIYGVVGLPYMVFEATNI